MFKLIFEYEFIRNAVLACLLASVVCGIVGVIIIEKKLVMMSGGIAHTAFGGVGLGYLIGFEPIFGALGFSVAAALGIGAINKKVGSQSEVIIGLFWSLGMALGIIFVGLRPGYPPDMNSYLFGNILSVTNLSLYMMCALTILVLAAFLCFFQTWKAYLFDEEFSGVIGLKTTFMDNLLLILVAITVVILIKVAGIILILAMLTAPAASAGVISRDLKRRILLAIVFGIFNSCVGLLISFKLNFASGAVIVISSVVVFLLVILIKKLCNIVKCRTKCVKV